MTKKCPKCGSVIFDTVNFCPNCGFQMITQSQENQNTNINSLESTKKLDFSNDLSFLKTKRNKVLLILFVLIVIVDTAIILTLFENNIEFTVLGAECTHSPTNPSQYVLRSDIMLYQVPSNLEGYFIRQTYYDKYNTRIGSSTESLASHSDWLQDSKYNVNHVIYLKSVIVNNKPHPDHVCIEIKYRDKTINNNTYHIDQEQIRF